MPYIESQPSKHPPQSPTHNGRTKIPGAGFQKPPEVSQTIQPPSVVEDSAITTSTAHRWLPGESGNPGGRPKSGTDLRSRFLKDPRIPEAFDRLMYMATDLDFGAWKPELQQRAAEYVTNQAIGQALQSVDVSSDAQEMYTAGQLALYPRLAELTGRALALPEAPAESEAPETGTDILLQAVNTPTADDIEAAPPQVQAIVPKRQTNRGRPKGSTDKTPRKPRTTPL